MSINAIPAGHRQDSRGRLVPESLIKPVDKLRDELVQELFAKAEQVQKALKEFKQLAFDSIESFAQLSAEQYGAKLGGTKATSRS